MRYYKPKSHLEQLYEKYNKKDKNSIDKDKNLKYNTSVNTKGTQKMNNTQSILNTLLRMNATLVCASRPALGLQCEMQVCDEEVIIYGCDNDASNGITCNINDISVNLQEGVLNATGIDGYGYTVENTYNIYIPITHVSSMIV